MLMKRREFIKTSLAAAVSASVLGGCAKTGNTMDEFVKMDALAQAELVRKGSVSARELVEAAIKRIERLNPKINAVITTLFDQALKKADAPQTGGPFAGVPYLLKDLVEYKGAPFTFGSALFRKNMGRESPELVRRSEAAGLIVLGKTNTPEFGLLPTTEPLLFGPTHNPWNLDYSPGGSSGGAAAAVASGMVPIAQASDGGGSIRIPASSCGLFGLKVSRGRMVYAGIETPGNLSVRHCVSRTVRDSAALLKVTAKTAAGGGTLPPVNPSKNVGKLKIAVSVEDIYGKKPHPDCVEAVESTAKLCESLGHHVEEARPVFDGQAFVDSFLVLWSSIPAGIVAEVTAATGHRPPKEALEPWSWGLVDYYAKLEKNAMEKALENLQNVTRIVEAFHEKYDVFLTPVLSKPPIKIGEQAPTVAFDELYRRVLDYVAYTPVANAAGIPAMSVPLHWNRENLPVGSHFSAKLGDESTLLSLAYQLEAARPWADRWAPNSALNV